MANFIIKPVASWTDAPQIKSYSAPYRGFAEFVRSMVKNDVRNKLIINTVVQDLFNVYIIEHSTLKGTSYSPKPSVLVICENLEHVNKLYGMFVDAKTSFKIMRHVASEHKNFAEEFPPHGGSTEVRIVLTTKSMFSSSMSCRPYCAIYLTCPSRSSSLSSSVVAVSNTFNKCLSFNEVNFVFRQFVDHNESSVNCAATTASSIAYAVNRQTSSTHAMRWNEVRLVSPVDTSMDKTVACSTFGVQTVKASWYRLVASRSSSSNTSKQEEEIKMDAQPVDAEVFTDSEMLIPFSLIDHLYTQGANKFNAAMYCVSLATVLADHSVKNSHKAIEVLRVNRLINALAECLRIRAVPDAEQNSPDANFYNEEADSYSCISKEIISRAWGHYNASINSINAAVSMLNNVQSTAVSILENKQSFAIDTRSALVAYEAMKGMSFMH